MILTDAERTRLRAVVVSATERVQYGDRSAQHDLDFAKKLLEEDAKETAGASGEGRSNYASFRRA
jgi:hypothetical protein